MKKNILSLICILALFLSFTDCTNKIAASDAKTNITKSEQSEDTESVDSTNESVEADTTAVTSLNVALYPYVPDPVRFQKAVTEKWAQVQPNVTLNFIDWDCYDDDPSDDLDVFVFDAIFLSHFIEQNYLLPIPSNKIQDSEDIFEFALDGCTANNNIYAIPQIICTNLLYNRIGDTEVADAVNVTELYDVVGDRQSSGPIPNENEGLLIDMGGGTTKACFYLDTLVDITQATSDLIPLPDLNNINMNAINNMKLLVKMGGEEQVEYWPDDNDSYVRAKWLEEGIGRTYIGYTEAMSSMNDFSEEVDFKLFSLSNTTNIPLFYGDVIGINSNITDPEKQELAIQLANVIAATDTMVQAISVDNDNPYPQYLLPARTSVYNSLAVEYPKYNKLLDLVSDENATLFVVGSEIRTWLEDAKTIIPPLIFDEAQQQ